MKEGDTEDGEKERKSQIEIDKITDKLNQRFECTYHSPHFHKQCPAVSVWY